MVVAPCLTVKPHPDWSMVTDTFQTHVKAVSLYSRQSYHIKTHVKTASSDSCHSRQFRPTSKLSIQTHVKAFNSDSRHSRQFRLSRQTLSSDSRQSYQFRLTSKLSILTHVTDVSSDSRQSYPFRLTPKLSIQTHVTAVSSEDSRETVSSGPCQTVSQTNASRGVAEAMPVTCSRPVC